MDRDGIADLVTTNRGFSIHNFMHDLSVWFGTGDGMFDPGPFYGIATGPYSLLLTDFDHDDAPDVVTWGNRTSLLFGIGNGELTEEYRLEADGRAAFAAAGDFDGDGNQDVVMSANRVELFFGDGSGEFEAGEPVSLAGLQPENIETGDLNRDGLDDIVISHSNDGALTVLWGAADRDLSHGSQRIPAGMPIYDVEVEIADMNGDGALDVVTLDGTGNNVAAVSIILGLDAVEANNAVGKGTAQAR
jgi:hypothetical protein